MAQRSGPSALALGGLAAGGLALLSSGAQQEGFAAPVADGSSKNLRAQVQELSSVGQAAPGPSARGALSAVACGGALAAAAVAGSRSSRRQNRGAPLPTSVVPMKEYRVARRGLDQSSHHAAFVGSSSNSSSRAQKTAANYMYGYQKDVYPELEFGNDVGYFPDGTPIHMAGNEINHPENIKADRHAPGSTLPAAKFLNSIGYLPDGTAMNMAGNEVNHPETMKPDSHIPGTSLPASVYEADSGYFVDGTAIDRAGNSLNHGDIPPPAPAAPAASRAAPAPVVSAAAFVGSSYSVSKKGATSGIGYMYSYQKDVYPELEFGNDVGYFPDGTAMNKAGNEINHPENIKPDRHAPGSPLPGAYLHNSIGYLPDGTAMNMAGNEINHPETMKPDSHAPGSSLPASHYAVDSGYFVDGTAIDKAGNTLNHA